MRTLTVTVLLITVGLAAPAASQVAPEWCVSSTVSPRVYSDNSGHWAQYSSDEKVPPGDVDTRAYWWKTSNLTLVRITVAIVDDMQKTSEYCYNSSGRLAEFRYEFWTAWGWGYNERRALNSAGQLTVTQSGFVKIPGGQRIHKPDQAADVEKSLRPEIYERLKEMPFAGVRPTMGRGKR